MGGVKRRGWRGGGRGDTGPDDGREVEGRWRQVMDSGREMDRRRGRGGGGRERGRGQGEGGRREGGGRRRQKGWERGAGEAKEVLRSNTTN